MFERTAALVRGMGLGAGLMYLFDPDRGRRRRALLRDQFDHVCHCTQDFLDVAQRDLANRFQGTRAEVSGMLRQDGADDRVVRERVRARLGRYVSHPHAVQVEAQDGRVVLSGQVLAHEAPALIQAVASVRGVHEVEDRLEPHEQAENLPALQGGRPRAGQTWDALQENWSPATRLVAQAAGLTLVGNCLARRTLTSTLFGAIGFGLFLRGTANQPIARLTGLEPGPASPTPQPAEQPAGT